MANDTAVYANSTTCFVGSYDLAAISGQTYIPVPWGGQQYASPLANQQEVASMPQVEEDPVPISVPHNPFERPLTLGETPMLTANAAPVGGHIERWFKAVVKRK